jgi:hypothetical protein
MTVQDLINLSLTLCGRLGAGRTAGAAESTVVFGIVNGMLDSWSTKRLAVYSVNLATFPLAAGTETYTIGTGAVFNTARPILVQSASIVATVEAKTARFPLRVIGQDEFSSLESFGDQAVIPKLLYYDAAFPVATIYLFPIPATNTHLDIWTWNAFTQFAALGDTVTLPPGYSRALSYNLAVEVAAAFGLQVPAVVAAIALSSKASIEAINARLMPDMELDRETAPPDTSSKPGKQ